jgi:hypothetical protein
VKPVGLDPHGDNNEFQSASYVTAGKSSADPLIKTWQLRTGDHLRLDADSGDLCMRVYTVCTHRTIDPVM